MQRTKRKSEQSNGENGDSRFDQVVIADIRKGRRGKHNDLLKRVIEDLHSLQEGSAIKIPLADVDGVSLANLRSAVHRGAAYRGVAIEPLSDDEEFYVSKPQKA